jgi:superfamily II DNA or RNA helicase
MTVGQIALKNHQSSAVTRVQAALAEFGGALLCDEVGMGKTYVAAAIARDYAQVLVIAPAGLLPMWKKALGRTAIDADLVSFERLSRATTLSRSYDLIVVDEAHHARNRATHRYRELQRLARAARVLLLTATPIHNRRSEMLALLSFFLGDRAITLTPDEVSRCVIRREHHQIEGTALIPEVLPVVALDVGDRADVVSQLMALPPPIAIRDGGLAQALVGRGLIHQWASSEAALHEALRKRIARATALAASLEVGSYPTEQELRTWTFADGALQLGFAELLSAPDADTQALLLCVKRHRAALEHLLASADTDPSLDTRRADILLDIHRSHANEKIVAFAQYSATVTMLFRKLSGVEGVAVLTARGARVAGGKMTREEALKRFAPTASGAVVPVRGEKIDMLLTTDLLSEGVNLQDAGVVVHLDIPWTSARMEQRVGRLARIGSTRQAVQPYLVSPPVSAARLLESEGIILRKWRVAHSAVGATASPPVTPRQDTEDFATSPAHLVEIIRSRLKTWRGLVRPGSDTLVACVASERSGFLAVASTGGRTRLVVEIDAQVSTDIEAQVRACNLANGPGIEASIEDYARAVARLERWVESERASSLAGTACSTLRRRRLLNRVDRAIEDASPHSRAGRLDLAMRARHIVAAQHSGAVEVELDALMRSELKSEEWLAAVAGLAPDRMFLAAKQSRGQTSSGVDDRSFVLHALLLFRRQSSD